MMFSTNYHQIFMILRCYFVVNMICVCFFLSCIWCVLVLSHAPSQLCCLFYMVHTGSLMGQNNVFGKFPMVMGVPGY